MGKQMTEMLKGTLEGIVLAILSGRPAYGYEITAWLRDQGFSDIAEGTVYALLVRIEQRGLVDVEKVPSEKGPPRKVYSLNAQGQAYLEEFWRTWSFLTERLEQLHEGGTMIMTHSEVIIVNGDRPHEASRWQAVQGPHRGPARAVRHVGRRRCSGTSCTTGASRTATAIVKMFGDFADLWERAAADGTPVRAIVGEDPVEFAETFAQTYTGQAMDRQGTRSPDQGDRARRREDAEREREQLMTTTATTARRSACRVWRSPTRSWRCCAAWTSTWRGAASSPCSAPTGPARPRS